MKKPGWIVTTLLFCLSVASCGRMDETTDIAAAPDQVLRDVTRHLSHAYAGFRSGQVSNPAYHLQLQLNADSDSFSGRVDISFDLDPSNVSPLTIDYDAGDITELLVNGESSPYDYERWHISIPAAALQPGHNLVSIAYERPYARDGAGLHKFTDPENGEVFLYTNFEPYDANRLFPHFDQPDLKAPLTLEVTAPASWQVIANTRETTITATADGLRHWVFPVTPAISSYIYAMHAGPFHVWESTAGVIPLRLFVRSALAPYVNTNEWFEPTRDSFAYFQDYFDNPYPFGKYDQVIVPDFNAGAMENVAAVTFSERYVTRGVRSEAQKRSLASVIAHEMAHMWFGDLVTMRWWNGLWLNESFATYMANRALDASGKFPNVWDSFYNGSKLSAYATDELVTTHPIELVVPTTADAFTNFDGITYGKGGSVLKQLPYFIGEENFRQGVSNYLKRHAWGNTELEDFVTALAEASGQDLTQWQHEWLFSSGVNTLQAEFACENDELTGLRLLQSAPLLATADKLLRSQRTQVGLYRQQDGALLATHALPVIYSGAVTEIPEAIGLPCPALIMPNEDDWAYFKIALDAVSLATLRDNMNAIANPTTRLMLWQALWDSVEDATMALDEFIGFVVDNAAGETDSNVLRHINGNLGAAFNYLAAFGGQDALLVEMERFLHERLAAATPGSEAQLIWLDSVLARSFSQEGLDYLHDLLQGVEVLEEVPIDQDRRWSIVRTLNRYLYPGHANLLATERERDGSDSGINAALAAEALRPDPAIKDAWLTTILENPESQKLATLRTVMAALFPPEQGEQLEAVAERLLAAVPALETSASQELLGEYTGYFGTGTCSESSVARLAAANERFAGMQPLVVKSYLIHHQSDERCLRIRQRME